MSGNKTTGGAFTALDRILEGMKKDSALIEDLTKDCSRLNTKMSNVEASQPEASATNPVRSVFAPGSPRATTVCNIGCCVS